GALDALAAPARGLGRIAHLALLIHRARDAAVAAAADRRVRHAVLVREALDTLAGVALAERFARVCAADVGRGRGGAGIGGRRVAGGSGVGGATRSSLDAATDAGVVQAQWLGRVVVAV